MTDAEFHQQQNEQQEYEEFLSGRVKHNKVNYGKFETEAWGDTDTVFLRINSGTIQTTFIVNPKSAKILADQLLLATRGLV